MSKRIVCWIGDAPNHRALVAKIARHFTVVGIVIDKKVNPKRKSSIASLPARLIDRLRFRAINHAWNSLQSYYREKFPALPAVPLISVDSINSEAALKFTMEQKPDLVCVSGTSLIKEPLVSLPLPIGILNLHTGLSPYVKGGPNCTNWCIANNQWSLIGNTIFWLSAGIDSGNILVSERVDVSDIKDLPAIHLDVMEHAHELYVKAVKYVVDHQPPYPSVSQKELGKGNLFLTRMWTAKKRAQLLKNLSATRNRSLTEDIKTVSLP